jgi:hypothetical protein
VGPVILVPEFVTQSVRNVWLPLTALHHRVVRSCRSPGDSVIVSEGLLTCKLLKKFRRWLNVTDVDPLLTRICRQVHWYGVLDVQPS